LIGRFGDGRSSDLKGLLLSSLAGLLTSSTSLWAVEPPFVAVGVKLEAESGLSGVGLEWPLEGDPILSGDASLWNF
jgi:hypothetical protein